MNLSVRFSVGLFLSAASGFLLDLAAPSAAIWVLAWIGVALALLSLWGQKPHVGLLFGLVMGATFWLPHISWLTLYLGPIPWAALSTLMIAWMGLAGAAIAALTRWLPPMLERHRAFDSVLIRGGVVAFSVAGIWVGRELIQGSWPYGGFPWGRVATLFAESPFAALSSWVGFAGLTGLVVFLVAFAITLTRPTWERSLVKQFKVRVVALGILASSTVLLALVPAYSLPTTGTVRVGAVQGNSDAGIFSDREPGDILDDHLRESEALVGEDLDFFVWPESALDLDPLRSPGVAAELDRITSEVGAPLVTGVITQQGGRYYNSSIVWEQDQGITQQYDKRRPVPFAEYMPNRSFYRAIVPELVDLVRLDYTPGGGSNTVDVAGVNAGVVICFDVIFDDLAVDMVDQGAQLVLAQTNNADFGKTDENLQQLAISRLRAVEMGRSMVVISTVGTSAMIAPSGQDIERLVAHAGGAMAADIPLHTGVTPAIALGWLYAAAFVGAGVAGLLVALTSRSLRGRREGQAQSHL